MININILNTSNLFVYYLGIVSYMDNACLKFELMGCEEPKLDPLLGYDYGYSSCVGKQLVFLCFFYHGCRSYIQYSYVSFR